MKIGLFGINFGALGAPEAMVKVAQAAEQAGLDSLWTGEHVVLPDPQEPPSPSPPQNPFLDPAVALSYVAAHTMHVRLGTGIIILPQRNPLVLAKELASVDVVSGGRLMFGLGAGYLHQEFSALGAPFEDRGAVTDEAIAVIKSLWTMEQPQHDGRYWSFSGIDAQPRPAQKPHPPIVIGGMSRAAARRAARVGNGWYGFMTDLEATQKSLRWIEEASGDRPSGLGPLEISVTPPPPLTAATIEKYESLGVHRLIALPRPDSVDSILSSIEELEKLLP